MKKTILTFLIMMIFAGFCVYAAQGQGFISGPVEGDTPNNGSVSVPVTFDLSGGTTTYWEIGFTSDDEIDLTSENGVQKIPSISLTYGGDDGTQGVPVGNVGVYWIIKGNPKLDITLGTISDDNTTGHLKSTDGDKINWEISWNNDQSIGTTVPYSSSEEGVSYEAKPVHSWTEDKTIDAGVMPLTIITQDIQNVKAASYSANLVLTIAPTT